MSLVSVYAAHDYGLMVEQLLALKLQVEAAGAAATAAAPLNVVPRSSDDTSCKHAEAEGGIGAATYAALLALPQPAQTALGRSAAGVAGRALRLLQDWQTAVLQLDALRTWQQQQRRMREAEEAAEGSGRGAATALPSTSRSVRGFIGHNWMERLLLQACLRASFVGHLASWELRCHQPF